MAPGAAARGASAETGLAGHRSLSRRRRVLDPWFRRGVLVALAALVGAGLLNVFGQRPVTSRSAGAVAALSVQSPTNLRGGLLFQARFTVAARRALRAPTLVLEHGWFESMSVNSIIPQPTAQTARNGEVRLTYPRMAAGDSLRVWIYFQVNPTTVGSRSQAVALDDGREPLARIERRVKVWP
jgi:hypothetical protein